MRGRFITLEGLDGAGKSTHLEWLAQRIARRGVRVKVTREPGGTPFGERLREVLLDRAQRLHPETETLLVFAARREHLDKVILPALGQGCWVLCDRFTDATYAYQAGGGGVPWERVAVLEKWLLPHGQPDLTLLFDVEPEVGRSRRRAGREPDRFEGEQEEFFRRVREAYLRRAQECPERIRVVDANGSLIEVQKKLEEIVSTICFEKG
ncbi:MAG TPA: dTMP kinase [Burkholderiales bacterium]|nr:dTMP kinase [Burkholderiales bacterium]